MKILTITRASISGIAVAALALTGVAVTAAPAQAAATSTWDRLADCEASGNWHINTGNGYYGGLQFTMGTWRAHGGSGNPANAGKTTQIKIAERVLDSQGWGAWPACSAKLGLRGGDAPVAAAHKAKHKAKHTAKPATKHVKVSKRTAVVRSGDTLSKIAQRHHVSGGWHRLFAANPKLGDPNVIHIGQRLHLPA